MLSKLQLNFSESVEEIHVFRSNWWTGMVPFAIPHGYEIGPYSSSVSSNTKNMVLCMLNELKILSPRESSFHWENLKITSSIPINTPPQSPYDYENDPVPDSKPTVLFIDMLGIK